MSRVPFMSEAGGFTREKVRDSNVGSLGGRRIVPPRGTGAPLAALRKIRYRPTIMSSTIDTASSARTIFLSALALILGGLLLLRAART